MREGAQQKNASFCGLSASFGKDEFRNVVCKQMLRQFAVQAEGRQESDPIDNVGREGSILDAEKEEIVMHMMSKTFEKNRR